MFIRALGIETDEDILAMFGNEDMLLATFEKDETANLVAQSPVATTLRVEALKEIFKKLRPGEPAQEDAAVTLINNFFFDPRRYDIAPVGRYKFDKKMALQPRIRNRVLAEDVISPLTGELLCEKGQVVTPEMADTIAHNAVNVVYIELDNHKVVKVFSNNTIEPEYILGFDLKDCGVNEKARIPVLMEIA